MAEQETPDEVRDFATRMFDLARSGATSTLVEYVRAGVPANLTNDSGDTLIMLAAYHGHADTVRALLTEGADPNRTNDKGQTPIAGAVFKGETDVVTALLDGGADPALGQPSAIDAARVFQQTEMLALFENR